MPMVAQIERRMMPSITQHVPMIESTWSSGRAPDCGGARSPPRRERPEDLVGIGVLELVGVGTSTGTDLDAGEASTA